MRETVARIRELALFGDLEEVTRAFIASAQGDRGQMFALMDVASLAYAAGNYEGVRAALAELHYLARSARPRPRAGQRDKSDG